MKCNPKKLAKKLENFALKSLQEGNMKLAAEFLSKWLRSRTERGGLDGKKILSQLQKCNCEIAGSIPVLHQLASPSLKKKTKLFFFEKKNVDDGHTTFTNQLWSKTKNHNNFLTNGFFPFPFSGF